MDESLARGMTMRLIREVSDREPRIRSAMMADIGRFPTNGKGARKAVSLIAKHYAKEYVDFLPTHEGTVARVCVLYGCTKGLLTVHGEHMSDVMLGLETVEIDHKKSQSRPIGMKIALSRHALQRVFQRVDFDLTDSRRFDFGPMYECFRDANLWTQTMLNAMRFGKVIGNIDSNVNLIIPTRHGAFVGAFSHEMSTVHIRSFLGAAQLGIREEQWLAGLQILREHQIDLSWVSSKNFTDPRVIGAFILAEEAGLFSVNWNRTNELKSSTVNLQAAAKMIERIEKAGVPTRRKASDECIQQDKLATQSE